MTFKFIFKLLIFTVVPISFSFSQNLGNSPYSTYGIGDITNGGNIRNIGMGGTGISQSNSEFINRLNPGLLHVNSYDKQDSSIRFTMLETALIGVGRNISQKDNNNVMQNQKSGGLNLQYFVFLLPLSKRLSTSVGLAPYSTIQNAYTNTVSLNDSINSIISNNYKGSISEVHFDNGFGINKNFAVGLHLGYLFGNVVSTNEATFAYYNQPFNIRRGAQNRDYYTGFNIKPGIRYRKEIKDSSGIGRNIFFNVGATVGRVLNATDKRTREFISLSATNGVFIDNDSLRSEQKFAITLPYTTSIGFSFDRPGKWTAAVDLSYLNWSVYKDVFGNSPFKDSYSVAVGAEWKPAKNVTLKSKEYRTGFTYTKLPLTFGSRQLDDISVSVGASLPVGRKDARYKSKPLTKINAALVLGTRGTTQDGLVKENYFRLSLGVIIHDKWFQRWKID